MPEAVFPLSLSNRMSYGLLALPLALIGLPLYVYLPTLFSQNTGLALADIGSVLLGARLIEALVDPQLGRWISYLHSHQLHRLRHLSTLVAIIMCGCVLLILLSPFWLVFVSSSVWRAVTLFICVLMAYVAFGWLSIVHYTLGVNWVARGETATRIYGVREGLALSGVLLGSVLPLNVGWFAYGLICTLLVFLGVWTLRPSWQMIPKVNWTMFQTSKASDEPLDAQVTWILIVFFMSNLAGSLPASLLGFYVADVLGLGNRAPFFLAIYFAAGAIGFSIWPKLATRYAPIRLWAGAMAGTAIIFAAVLNLSAQTPHVAIWFGCVSAMTGSLLGAEWILPQSAVASRLTLLGQTEQAGRIFGLWTWVQKMALAIATGVALWGLAGLGYKLGGLEDHHVALTVLYGLAPAVIKLLAASMAWKFIQKG